MPSRLLVCSNSILHLLVTRGSYLFINIRRTETFPSKLTRKGDGLVWTAATPAVHSGSSPNKDVSHSAKVFSYIFVRQGLLFHSVGPPSPAWLCSSCWILKNVSCRPRGGGGSIDLLWHERLTLIATIQLKLHAEISEWPLTQRISSLGVLVQTCFL